MTGAHFKPEYKDINPHSGVPALVHGRFKLSEAVAILQYLADAKATDDQWYPKDPQKRAKVD